MPYYLPPDYLDNTAQRTLADTLARLIREAEQRQLDVAAGYFEPSAWRHLRDTFPLLERFHLLLGTEPELAGQGEERLDLRRYFRQQLQGDLEQLPFNAHYADLVDSLITFLEQELVQVRLYPSFLHAKAYLFSQFAIVGSSNLTHLGLTRKAELNLVHKSETVAAALRQNWFEVFWQEAEEYKADLIQALADSKFGGTAYTPFQVFIKALYEYFKDRLLPPDALEFGGVSLASFQQEGLREAIRLLDRHRGVLVADAVGLGKTYIGMGLLEHYLLRRRRRGHIPKGLVVCPAQLRDLMWRPKLDEYGIKATILSMEEMGRSDFAWKDFNHYDLVLVDESHNFRNPGTGRYQNLSKIISTGREGKYVILMTATPINNTIWDLYHQMMLMTRGSDAYFRDQGIRNLAGFFKRVADGAAELFDLLEETTVRRSRYDVRKRQEAGEVITLPGKGEIRFPERALQAITYNLERTYRGFYAEIAAQIENLNLVSYNIEEFRRDQSSQTVQQEIQRNSALIGIIKTTFLKRLESSLVAFERSAIRQQKFQQRFFDLLQQGRLLDSGNHRKILALEDEAEGAAAETAVADLIVTLPEVDAREYDLAAIGERLESDLAILKDLRDWMDIVRQAGGLAGQDAKLAEVKAVLAGPLKGQKVLLFTYYQDTADYLYQSLRADKDWWAAAGQPVMGLITGATGNRVEVVRRFAPVANTSEDEEGQRERAQLRQQEIQILISTDVLSEGQNLQDAGVLINYDLHWNPVRMIQRAGRIDRLGTPYTRLTIYNCFPEEGLEALLRLVERLQQRIANIDRTVGLDASVLGETIHPRSLEELKRIKAGEREVLDELERLSELVSTDEMKLPLILYLQSVGEEQMKEIPLGIHSGKRAAMAGTFFAFRARDRHFWRFYPTGGGPVITDKKRIFQLLFCGTNEPRVIPHHNIFPLLEQATQDIFEELRAQRATARIRPRLTGLNKTFYETLNQLKLLDPVPNELRQRVSQVLQDASLATFRRDPALKAIQTEFKQDGNARLLAEQLDAYFVENGLYREVVEPTILEQIKEEDLQLVCYEMLTIDI